MDNGLKRFIKKASVDQASSLVGKLCSQIEVLLKQSNLSEETRKNLELCKALRKELIYQEFRSLRDAVTFYLEGREHQVYPIYNPEKKDDK